MARTRNDVRTLIAEEAARVLAEDGIRDYGQAKRKAAARFGVRDLHNNLPTNVEVEQALVGRQRLFGSAGRVDRLRELRTAALSAMRLLKRYEPRLVGPVLVGTATEHSDVQLHIFADGSEQVAIDLMGRGIPFEQLERRMKRVSGGPLLVPVYRFMAGDVTVEAAVFGPDAIREAPASAVDGRPMRRANAREVEGLLED
jgi:hypothetical protein